MARDPEKKGINVRLPACWLVQLALLPAAADPESLLQWPKMCNAPLTEIDPTLYDIIEKEKNRQWKVCSFAAAAAPPCRGVYTSGTVLCRVWS